MKMLLSSKLTRNIILGVIIFGLIVGVFLFFGYWKRLPSGSSRFVGVITDIKDSCQSDGICAVKVGNSWVVVEFLDRDFNTENAPKGRLVGLNFFEPTDVSDKFGIYTTSHLIGKKVEVYAGRDADLGFTLYGKRDYYIKYISG